MPGEDCDARRASLQSASMRRLLLPLLLVAFLSSGAAVARSWTDEIIYFVLTDRFFDGDPDLYDPQQLDINCYHGGDLRGLELAIRAGYFEKLGISALWITPPVRNTWRSGYDLGGWKTGYHGYWAQDFLDIDPRLASRQSLDGEDYPDSPEGRMRHYRDFVELAHSRGLKVVQDVVLNHAGPVFFYDADGDGEFDEEKKNEWVQPFRRDGYHGNASWASVPKWNLARTGPEGPRDLLGRRVPTSGVLAQLGTYGRRGFSSDSLGKSDGEEVMCDFFSLRDFWTGPGSSHFDQLVDEFVEIYSFYLTEVRVDALRIDTVKHVHHEFWDAFTERLRRRLGPAAKEKLIFGEVYDGDPAVLGRYTWRSDWKQNPGPCLDSVLDFQFCFSARNFLRHPGGKFESPRDLEKALKNRRAASPAGRPFYHQSPGPDGLNGGDKAITFVENHDGLNRFRVHGVTERRNRLAQALVLTSPGIPCLYYGTEISQYDADGRIGQDGETGRATLFRSDHDHTWSQMLASSSFNDISRLTALRRKLPALRDGEFAALWVDSDGRDDDNGW